MGLEKITKFQNFLSANYDFITNMGVDAVPDFVRSFFDKKHADKMSIFYGSPIVIGLDMSIYADTRGVISVSNNLLQCAKWGFMMN
mmetsp:Transcript_15749/g.28638  ORF Transcript_15749/g.28638 Transcript_15749/m.28638 type:complete len:86 (-) Transcript_15749:99-356(-)